MSTFQGAGVSIHKVADGLARLESLDFSDPRARERLITRRRGTSATPTS